MFRDAGVADGGAVNLHTGSCSQAGLTLALGLPLGRAEKAQDGNTGSGTAADEAVENGEPLPGACTHKARSEVEVDREKSPGLAPEEIIGEIVDRLIVMGRGLRICECGQHGVRMQSWEATP